jgi:hypothetical protein
MAVPSRKHQASRNRSLLKDKKFRDEVAKREKDEIKEKNPEDVKNLFETIKQLKSEMEKRKNKT